MKNKYLFLFCFFLISHYAISQTIGIWKSHLSYHNTTEVVETYKQVFAVANNSLYCYNKEDNSICFYSSLNGLNDASVQTIGYSHSCETLVIIYTNGNIDLLHTSSNRIKNIPYIKNDMTLQNKIVNSISFHNEYAYLSTQFGIVVINLKKEEINETCKLRENVYTSCINDGFIYAATESGVKKAALNSNLIDPNNWFLFQLPLLLNENEVVQDICFFLNTFTFYVNGKKNHGVYSLQTDGNIKLLSGDNQIKGITLQNKKLIIYAASYATVSSTSTDKFTLTHTHINGISSFKDNNIYWIAAGNDGLIGIKKKGDGFEKIVSELELDSPIRNLNAFMLFHNQKLLVTGGGRWGDRYGNPGTLMVYEEDKWYNFDKAVIDKRFKVGFKDVTSVAVDPLDDNHYYVSTWGEGVFEFKDNAVIDLHNNMNSELETAIPKDSTYVRVEGLCFDNNNNLWMTNSSVSKGLKVLKADGTWKALVPEMNGCDLIDKILITNSGHKWINVIREPSYIFVFDDNKTLDDESDDTVRKIDAFYHTYNGSATRINASRYYCMAEDKKSGSIWIGTNIGIIVCPNPRKVIENPSDMVMASRLVREDENSLFSYFLDGEDVSSIAIDGGNRKWIGTEKNGVFVVSEDGSETIEHFTTDNSPLPSNKIESLTINNHTGEVYIGTEYGLFSYMSGAPEGEKTYSDVYAYPNPVRPEHNEQVTICGLIADSNVKITDINGNIIYQGRSTGGQLTWNCRSKTGSRVASGIYLVLSYQPEEGESVATKIMVIR